MTSMPLRTLLTALLVLPLAVTAAADDDARELVERTWKRYRDVETERVTQEILIVASPQEELFDKAGADKLAANGGAGVTHKRAVRHLAYDDSGEDRIHIAFSLPPEDEGTAFLVRRRRDANDDQWLYMPALRRVRRIPVSSSQTFVGTNLTYEDVRELAGERTARFTYARTGEATLEGRRCITVEARPAEGTSSAYPSRVLWIDAEWEFPVKIEYRDAGGIPWKIFHASSVREVAPGVRRADLSEMRDLRLNEATLLLVTERAIGLDIPPEVFTVDALEHPVID